MVPSAVRYASSPGGKIAYRTLGDGPIDLLVSNTAAWSLDRVWEHPLTERWLRRLAAFSRVVVFAPRGTACSDPVPVGITMEEWTQDVVHVLDAVGSERSSCLWGGDVAAFGMLVAAAFPERTAAVIVIDGYARLSRASDYPCGIPLNLLERMDDVLVERWGSGGALEFIAPEAMNDARFVEWYAQAERATQSPAMFALTRGMLRELDVRSVLPSVQAPTLVIAHTDDPYLRPCHGRYLAEHLPNARLVERPGRGVLPWLHDVDGTVAEIQSFLTGASSLPDIEDRFLAAVMFTDIVDSTKQAAAMGDATWRRVLDDHDRLMGRLIERFRGAFIKSTGDGLLATFDGPARAIRCALAMRDAVKDLGFDIRVGVHAGEVEQRGDDIGGIAVAIAARVMAEAGAAEVLVSSAVPPLVAGSGLEFTDRGTRALKGVPGEWHVLAATPAMSYA